MVKIWELKDDYASTAPTPTWPTPSAAPRTSSGGHSIEISSSFIFSSFSTVLRTNLAAATSSIKGLGGKGF
ncbi:hypothetical protein GOBAR_AA11987 [Gossypium barbadense]|uniref:Uncharacterized protein n=1 Tax=Gossypium barbadense TaxID=3634 RepID=A0A2P5XZ69_GOSBA|nr:hypothetical protein GOBAR_AA11987 [Gossypium barbadense]